MSRGKRIIRLAGSAGPCGWLLLAKPVLYLLTARGRDLDQYATVDASAAINIAYTFVCFLAVIVESTKRQHSRLGNAVLSKTPMFWFLIYTVYGFISMVWSVNMQLTVYRAFECLAMMLLMLMVWQRLFAKHNMDRVMEWCILWVGLQVVCQIISTLRWTTDPLRVLGASQTVATTFFFMALYHSHKRWIHWLIIVMAIMSGSTVAYIGMAIGTISIFWGKAKYKVPVFIFALLAGAFIYYYGPQKFIKDTVFYDKEAIAMDQTSGRDQVMEVALISLQQNPMGYGFFAGEPYILYQHFRGAINGHNSFFSAAMGLGYVGIVLLFIFFLGMFRVTFYRGIPRKYRQPLIGCFFVGFLHCMGNPGIGSRVYGSWMPVMLLFTLICSFYAYNNNKIYVRNMGHKKFFRLQSSNIPENQ
jgi:hypothetical protein